jgi:hypothetical protein
MAGTKSSTTETGVISMRIDRCRDRCRCACSDRGHCPQAPHRPHAPHLSLELGLKAAAYWLRLGLSYAL